MADDRSIEEKMKRLESRYNVFAKLVIERLDALEHERDAWAWLSAAIINMADATEAVEFRNLVTENLQTFLVRADDAETAKKEVVQATLDHLRATSGAMPPYDGQMPA
ncbi:MAG: hypothetical protein ACPG4X_14550 [Pikeienuella sp.]